jgi:hypothetical protein
MKSWMIPTHNNPLGTARDLLKSLWQYYDLDSILLPLNGMSRSPGPDIVDDPKLIQSFNPFTPVMPINAATLIPNLACRGRNIAAVFRPCEMRTLSKVINLEKIKIKKFVTISVDCLGTLPMDDFDRCAKRKGSPKGLTQEALKLADQAEKAPYHYRAACQICKSPEATLADINIHVLGLPVRQYILINTKDIDFRNITIPKGAMPADSTLQNQHQLVVSRLSERGHDTRLHILRGLSGVLPKDIDSLIELFKDCGKCRSCMDNCPLCSTNFPNKDHSGNYIKDDILRWLISCSDCGVCEQSCPKYLPLTIIFAHIRQQLENISQLG